MAIAFPESNSVMITAPALILEACEQVIREIDVEPKQVYIEARFVELSNNVFHDIGIDWSMLDGMRGTVSLGGGIQKNRLGKGVQDYTRTVKDGTASYTLSGSTLTGGADGDIAYFNGTLDFSQMYVVLSALEGSQDARIFSNPKIIVSSGRKATVDMTTKYPNVKIAAKRTTTSGSDSLDLDMQMSAIPGEDKFMFAKEAFFSWGISLDVTPRIGTNGLINVSIVPTISSQNGWVESGTESDADSGTISARFPVIEVQRLVTEFAMASGTTAVIGGLSRTVEEQVNGAFDQMERRLALFGLTLENVVQMDCLFRDVWNIPVMEKVIRERFHGRYPVRKSIQTEFAHVGGPDGLQFQLDAIAWSGDD